MTASDVHVSDVHRIEVGGHTLNVLSVSENERLNGLIALCAFPDRLEVASKGWYNIVCTSQLQVLNLIFILVTSFIRFTCRRIYLLAGELEDVGKAANWILLTRNVLECNVSSTRLIGR